VAGAVLLLGHADDHGRGRSGAGELVAPDGDAAEFFQRVVQPLPVTTRIHLAAVGRARCRAWGQGGQELGAAGRGEPALQVEAAIRARLQQQFPDPVLLFLAGQGAVGGEVGQVAGAGDGDLARAGSTNVPSAAVSSATVRSGGNACRVRVMTCACSPDTSPAACAAATAGSTGSSGSPVNACRGPHARAVSTRRFASCGESHSSPCRSADVEGIANTPANPRRSSSATSA
jgi:hypothetical protein